MSGSSPLAGDLSLLERIRSRLRIRSDLYRCVLAEFICTAMFVWAGTSVLAQTVLSRGRNNEYISVPVGFALALTFATQLGQRISGSHLNPAVSLFFYSFGQISLARLLLYVMAQMGGGFTGALLTFVLYWDALNAFDGADHLSTFGGIIDQVFGTAFLCICIGMITDRRNRIDLWLQSTLIGLSLALIGTAFGYNAGFGVNPARDLGPRLFTLCVGYGWKVFSFRNYKWFWIPVLAPLLGGILGAWIYQLAIGIHIPSEIDELEEKIRRIQFDKAQNHNIFVQQPSQATTVVLNSSKPPAGNHGSIRSISSSNSVKANNMDSRML
uniref:Uncharacterized protein n=1 Tax=Ditylenchus dipsaci TaxID=166011 RepID=A0A915D2T2_9BILA